MDQIEQQPYQIEVAPSQNETEHKVVKKLWKQYDDARKFDKAARKQYAIDRRYAAGTADLSWAVSTNLLGSYIDVLVSYLYARDPDVSVRKSERVDNNGDQQDEDFARTLELIISQLWKRGRLKKTVRKMVRSSLSTGPGWFKAIMVTDKAKDPQVEAALNDARDNLARLEAQQKELASGEGDDFEVKQAEIQQTIQGLEANLEVIVRKGMAIDHVPSEDMQVSLDVRQLDDYLEANWLANAMYKPKSEIAEMFPRLSEDDIKKATVYYQQQPAETTDDKVMPLQSVTDEQAEQFSTSVRGQNNADAIEFARIVELWDKRDNLIKTIVEGVPCWAREPYTPPQATSRFYPYFLLEFYPVDGARHGQSLSWRLRKLQDEYSASRSSWRLTRERAVPGTLFNAEQIDEANARKLTNSDYQEFIGLKPTNPGVDMKTLFAEKPVSRVDPMLYNVEPIVHDMEKVSGVQESLQASVVQPKTATEADIQQSGFAARSSSDRDTLEEVLGEFAKYTAEVALQTVTVEEAQRMVGAGAFWPFGMSTEDIVTMVEVDIQAGTTGKPNTAAERQSWTVAMPLIKQTQIEIAQFQMQGNIPMVRALSELLRETLNRLGDRIDVERFLPLLPELMPTTQATMPLSGPVSPAGAPAAPVPAPVPGGPAPADVSPEVPTKGTAENLDQTLNA